jgi:hypothetical protein
MSVPIYCIDKVFTLDHNLKISQKNHAFAHKVGCVCELTFNYHIVVDFDGVFMYGVC